MRADAEKSDPWQDIASASLQLTAKLSTAWHNICLTSAAETVLMCAHINIEMNLI